MDSLPAKLLLHQFLHVGHVHGVAGQQQFVDGIVHLGGQIRHFPHRDLVDAPPSSCT